MAQHKTKRPFPSLFWAPGAIVILACALPIVIFATRVQLGASFSTVLPVCHPLTAIVAGDDDVVQARGRADLEALLAHRDRGVARFASKFVHMDRGVAVLAVGSWYLFYVGLDIPLSPGVLDGVL